MGCLPSRSTTVRPADPMSTSSGQPQDRDNKATTTTTTTGKLNGTAAQAGSNNGGGGGGARGGLGSSSRPSDNQSDSSGTAVKQKQLVDIGTSLDMDTDNTNNNNNNNESQDNGGGDDMMSIMMDERTDDPSVSPSGANETGGDGGGNESRGEHRTLKSDRGDNNNSNNNSNGSSKVNSSRTESKRPQAAAAAANGDRDASKASPEAPSGNAGRSVKPRAGEPPRNGDNSNANGTEMAVVEMASSRATSEQEVEGGGTALSTQNSFDDELNMDLLRQYLAIDYEISQLEDRDALRLYHEKIEHLEQLERELNMINFEAEEMAVRNETDAANNQLVDGRAESGATVAASGSAAAGANRAVIIDMERNSIVSGATGQSMSPGSSIMRSKKQQQQQQLQQQIRSSNRTGQQQTGGGGSSRPNGLTGQHLQRQRQPEELQLALINGGAGDDKAPATTGASRYSSLVAKENNLSYSTIEDVFSRKIILEKERDRLKKEVELVIIECDKLQQRYKRRDEILDKLFDGRSGNGLENHLEQQLNWLMEQKHYVDQVFYAWKRAETLTSQTCEQFANALELLKRSSKVRDGEQRQELARSICQLLIKSRQDMEQAQRYNPNVDAPFFTDAETERFDRIIDALQSSKPIGQSDYNQMATVVQFAYKRAVSIRLWLEQILQITIARDSFELAEEYKWIAIQLRKERISLINSKLQDEPYRQMAQSLIEQLARQQQQQQLQNNSSNSQTGSGNQLQLQQQQQRLAITDGKPGEANGNQQNGRQNENNNRDSGIESDDIDIEEDINRLLEMNRSRLEAALAASKEAGVPQATALDANGRPLWPPPTAATGRGSPVVGGASGQQQLLQLAVSNSSSAASASRAGLSSAKRDQMMRERIQRRVQGDQKLASAVVTIPFTTATTTNGASSKQPQVEPSGAAGTFEAQSDGEFGQRQQQQQQLSSAASSTPTKLRVLLDESSRQDLLNQVYQVHAKHRKRLDNLRGNNKAKTSDILVSKLQQQQQQQPNRTAAATVVPMADEPTERAMGKLSGVAATHRPGLPD